MATIDEIRAKYCADSALLEKFKKMDNVTLGKTINQMSGPKFWDLKKVAAELKAKAASMKADKDDARVASLLALFRIKA